MKLAEPVTPDGDKGHPETSWLWKRPGICYLGHKWALLPMATCASVVLNLSAMPPG